jgi:hypothetical protein
VCAPLLSKKDQHTTPYDVVIAAFDDHRNADATVRKLSGFDMKNFSVVGKGYHTEEKIVGSL